MKKMLITGCSAIVLAGAGMLGFTGATHAAATNPAAQCNYANYKVNGFSTQAACVKALVAPGTHG